MQNELARTAVDAVLMAMLIAISGCGHKGEVEDLIEAACPSMKDSGSLQFVSYSESKVNDWSVRTFRASGKVRWTEDRFYVVKTLKAYGDLPEVVITSEAKELKEGVRFYAVFYRGRTNEKGSASVSLPRTVSYTKDGLEEKYPHSYVYLPDGDYLGRKFDKKKYKTLKEEIIKRGNAVAKDMSEERLKLEAKVDAELKVDFRNLNDKDLENYASRCDELQCGIRVLQGKVGNLQSDLEYFSLSPLKDMGQDEAKKCCDSIVDQKDLCQKLLSRIENRYQESNSECDTRRQKGVRFVRGVKNVSTKPTRQRKNPITLRMPTSASAEISDVRQNASQSKESRSASAPGNTPKNVSVQKTLPKVEQSEQKGAITIRMPAATPAFAN